jgi:hypothetical protein
MINPKCSQEIKDIVKDYLTNKESKDLLNDIEDVIKEKTALKEPIDEVKIAKELLQEKLQQIYVDKLNKFRDTQRLANNFNYVTKTWSDDPVSGMKSLLVGVISYKEGSRFSIDNIQQQYRSNYIGGFNFDLEKADLGEYFQDKNIHKDIFTEVMDNPFLKDQEGAINRSVSGNEKAYEIAKIIKKWNDIILKDKNDLGANIAKLEGYIFRQSHQTDKLLKAGGRNVTDEASHKEAWISKIKPRLNHALTFKGDDPDKVLSDIWGNLINGKHIKSESGSVNFGSRNIPRRQRAERVLHFKSGKDFYDYDQEFGIGNLGQALEFGFTKTAQDVGMVKVLGTNPRNGLDKLITLLKNHYRGKGISSKDINYDKIRNEFEYLDGSVHIPDDATIAKIGAGIRTLQTIGKLDQVTITSLTDIVYMMAEANYQGMNIFSTFHSALKELKRIHSPAELKEILEPLNLGLEHFAGQFSEHFTTKEGMIGNFSNVQSGFFKMIGFTGLMRRYKSSFALAMQNYYGSLTDKSWDNLPDKTKNALGLFSIDGAKWDIMRKTKLTDAEGRRFLTMKNLDDIPDDLVTDYIQKFKPEIKKITPKKILDFKKEIQSNWRMFLHDRIHFAVLEPGAREKAAISRGFRKGDFIGEMWHMATQFKTFPIIVVMKALAREFKGYQPGMKYSATLPALSMMAIMGTVMGYMVLSIKDMLKGREPADPKDLGTITRAFTQFGGGGIIWDLFNAELSRSNGGALTTLAGPTYSDIQGIFKALVDVANGKSGKAGVKAVKLFEANTPVDAWFIRPAWDFMVGYQLKELLDPGYFRRLEGYYLQNTGQEFFLKP